MHSARHAVLTTARLRLRPWAAADAAALVPALNDLAVSGWLAPVPFPFLESDFHSFLPMALPGQVWVIEDDTGPAGSIGLQAALGYWLAQDRWGRGYATEAARAVLKAHFAAVDAADVASGYFEGNARSARILAKMGFAESSRAPRMCRALGVERPHVNLRLDRAGFVAAQPAAVTTA